VRDRQPPPYHPGPPSGGGGPANSDAPRRPDLRIVSGTSAEADAAPVPPRAGLDDGGPHRLLIELEETTDEPADVRRIRRICSALDEHPGDLPVEIRIQRRNGDVVRLARGTVALADLEQLVPRIRAFIGVLGTVREAGTPEVEAAPAPDLAAVGA